MSPRSVKLNCSYLEFCEHISSLTFVAEFSGQQKFKKKIHGLFHECTRNEKQKLNTCSESTCPYYNPTKTRRKV